MNIKEKIFPMESSEEIYEDVGYYYTHKGDALPCAIAEYLLLWRVSRNQRNVG